MKRLDDDKVSHVDFLRSIRFGRHGASNPERYRLDNSPQFRQHSQTGCQPGPEDSQVVRSAN